MAPDAPQLPSRFPCWCRAVYSWGGETKRDLGFVEGDLIECLNAGDGSWWTGRLHRDRRMVGVFPSNFVKVLDEGFVPCRRSVSPLPPSGQVSSSNSPAGGPKKQKTVFRKPFQGYKEVIGPSGTLSRQSTTVESPVTTPVAQKQTVKKSRDPDRTPTARRNEAPVRPPSRAISPAPPPPVMEPENSPPPPPPPPHRILHRRSVSPQPQFYQQMPGTFPPRTPSPYPPQTPLHGNTPSPLRDAIEDVMTSLHDMGLRQGPSSPEPPRAHSPYVPWGPDAFDQGHSNAPIRSERPLTSLGFGQEQFRGEDYHYQQNNPNRYYDGPPQLSNYVERMESRLRQLHAQDHKDELHFPPPPPPKKGPQSGNDYIPQHQRSLRNRRSNNELNSAFLGRTHTTKSTATNSSSGVQSVATNSTTSTGFTSQSLMSGTSAGGYSATSAASFARRSKVFGILEDRPESPVNRPHSRGPYGLDRGNSITSRPQTPLTGISYHSSHGTSRQGANSAMGWSEFHKTDSPGILGGLSTPKSKKTGFFKKILETAKTSAATARSNIAASQMSRPSSPTKNLIQSGIASLSPTRHTKDTSKDMGIGTNDWVQVRRDVNRATTPSRIELIERVERCQMMDYPVISPVRDLHEIAEGDEGIDGLPIAEPTNWNNVNLQLVDKSARFVTSLPPMMNPTSLAQGYVCRPYRSDAQRLRAIFTWVGEKIAWDDDLDGDVDLRRVILMKRGCPQEVAVLVMEMCAAVGIHAETVRGYLKTPGEVIDFDSLSRPNHWWNAVLIDGEWRIMDCSLASPTHPRRSLYSSASSQAAENWYFLARPMEICYTHIPVAVEQQHICPPIDPAILLSLPCACPAYFRNGLLLPSYDTSQIQINGLETVQVRIHVPPDIECAAEVEAIAFAHDCDGDRFESGDIIRKKALSQPDWFRGQKRFTIKAVLPGDEGQGVLKVYAGKKGLMHSSKDIPHPLAFAIPIFHSGENPPYEFILRHPTPHAQRHDLYVIQPQCGRLSINNTFVFAVRQHPAYSPSTTASFSDMSGRISPNPFARPSSSLSMVSSIASASNASTTSVNSRGHTSRDKPAKLAIQTPSGKILRLTRRADHMITTDTATEWANDGTPDGSVWETVIKVSERGVWRGLVLADRSARWCVWGEWECL